MVLQLTTVGPLHVIWVLMSVCAHHHVSVLFVLQVTSRLVFLLFKTSTIDSQIFRVAAARTWNDLPEDVTLSQIKQFLEFDGNRTCITNHILTLLCSLPDITSFPGSDREYIWNSVCLGWCIKWQRELNGFQFLAVGQHGETGGNTVRSLCWNSKIASINRK